MHLLVFDCTGEGGFRLWNKIKQNYRNFSVLATWGLLSGYGTVRVSVFLFVCFLANMYINYQRTFWILLKKNWNEKKVLNPVCQLQYALTVISITVLFYYYCSISVHNEENLHYVQGPVKLSSKAAVQLSCLGLCYIKQYHHVDFFFSHHRHSLVIPFLRYNLLCVVQNWVKLLHFQYLTVYTCTLFNFISVHIWFCLTRYIPASDDVWTNTCHKWYRSSSRHILTDVIKMEIRNKTLLVLI